MRNSKLCFLTPDNFEIRIIKKISFDIVDDKGFKQNLIVIDYLYQNKRKSNNLEARINQSKLNLFK